MTDLPKSNRPKTFLVAVLVAITLGIIFSGRTLNKGKSTVFTQAAPQCDERCLREDPCCAQMVAEQDYSLCEWADPRGYCRPETCDKLPPGLEGRGRCGWYWGFHDAGGGDLGTNTANGYGCMIGSSPETMVPICGSPTRPPQPTQPPQPTDQPTARPTRRPTQPTKPTNEPTQKPTKEPTEAPEPTDSKPTSPNAIIPTTPFTTGGDSQTIILDPEKPVSQDQGWEDFDPTVRFSLPTVPLPRIEVVGPVGQTIEQIDRQLPRSLDFAEYVFGQLKTADSNLESALEERLKALSEALFGFR